jgi:hypothetical protein
MSERMKILIGYDGSDCANHALEDVKRAGLPAVSECSCSSSSALGGCAASSTSCWGSSRRPSRRARTARSRSCGASRAPRPAQTNEVRPCC